MVTNIYVYVLIRTGEYIHNHIQIVNAMIVAKATVKPILLYFNDILI